MVHDSRRDGAKSVLSNFATRGYFAAMHIRFTRPLFQEQTLPADWVEHYTAGGLFLRDPAMAWGYAHIGYTRWSEITLPDAAGIFAQAREFGLNFGVVVAHGPPDTRSIVILARHDREATAGEMMSLHRAVVDWHTYLRPSYDLTPAQIAALKAIADGGRQADVAEMLGISVSALKARLAAARASLGAKTINEAIKIARDYRLL